MYKGLDKIFDVVMIKIYQETQHLNTMSNVNVITMYMEIWCIFKTAQVSYLLCNLELDN